MVITTVISSELSQLVNRKSSTKNEPPTYCEINDEPTGKHWSVCLCVALSSSSACLWNLKWVCVGLDMADMIYCWFKSLMPWQIEGAMLRIKTCLWLSLSTVCSFCLSLGTILRSTWFFLCSRAGFCILLQPCVYESINTVRVMSQISEYFSRVK